MSLHRFNLLLSFFLSCSMATANSYLPVEPFFANWCARQFPVALGTTFNNFIMLEMTHTHVEPIAPYIGDWCLQQFPDELHDVDRDATVAALYDKSKPLFPELLTWGKLAILANLHKKGDIVPLEPFFGSWCMVQFPQLKDMYKSEDELRAALKVKHHQVEPTVADWCFAQFPEELSGINKDAVLEELNGEHALLENELILYTLAQGDINKKVKGVHQIEKWVSKQKNRNEKKGLKITVGILVPVLVLSWVVLFMTCRRLKNRQVETSKTGDNEDVPTGQLA